MSQRAWTYLFLLLSCAVLSVAFAWQSSWVAAGATTGLAFSWAIAEWRGWAWLASLSFFLMVLLSAAGILTEVAPIVALLTITLAIMAWESGRFNRLLLSVERIEGKSQLIRAHRLRLGLVAVLGLSLGAVAAFVRTELGFAFALPLACISVLGFSLAINFMRRYAH